MQVKDIKVGDIINDREILSFTTKIVSTFKIRRKKQETYNRTRLVTKCIYCGSVKELDPYYVDKHYCKNPYCPRKYDDLTGKKFGSLTALRRISDLFTKIKPVDVEWEFMCACGIKEIIRVGRVQLNSRDTKIQCAKCGHRGAGKKRQLPNHMSEINKAVYRYTQRSLKEGNKKVSLTRDDFIFLFKQPCFYCGVEYFEDEDILRRNGVDRIDNTKGYHKDNTVPCCFMCNKMKHSTDQQLFLEHVEKIYKHMEEKRSETIPEGSTPK